MAPPTDSEWLVRASDAAEKGDPAVADAICRQLLLTGRGGAAAWNIIGRVAMRLHRPAHAVAAFERALAIDQYFKPATKNLKAAQDAVAKGQVSVDASAGTPRYHVILAFGHGFWADVDHVLGQLVVAEITGRTPIIHWGASSLYGDDPAVDAWRQFFEPVSSTTLADVLGKGYRFFPGVWTDHTLREGRSLKPGTPGSRLQGLNFLDRPEEVTVSDWHTTLPLMLEWVDAGHRLAGKGLGANGVPPVEAYRDLIYRYVRITPEIAAEVDAFDDANLRGRPSVGVHLRGSDKFTEVPMLRDIMAKYPAEIRRRLGDDPASRLFVITDSDALLQSTRSEYGDRVVAADCIRTDGPVGLHHMGQRDRKRLGVEVIRDVLIAARCRQFVGLGWSNVTNFTRYFKDWPDGAWIALGPPGHGHYAPL